MSEKKPLYILVADTGRAKIFKAARPLESLEPVFDQVNFQGRKRPSEIYSDKAGSQNAGSGGFHSFAGERDTHEDVRFSRELSRFLCEEHRAGKFSRLVLVSPPHFLGEMRKHLEHECPGIPLQTVNKDLVKMADDEILENLRKTLPSLKTGEL